MNALASFCVILLVLWTLVAYSFIPLPINDSLFAWLRRQWLLEGIAGLAFVGTISVIVARWRSQVMQRISWWPAWLMWIACAGVSMLYSIDRGMSLRSELAFVSYGLLAFVTCALINTPRDVTMWLRFFATTAVILSLEGLFQYFGAFGATLRLMERLQTSGELDFQGWGEGVIKDFLIRKRIFSVFGWPNLYAGFLLLMIPMAVSLCIHAGTRLRRVGWWIASGLLGTSLILTLSMGGWIAAILTGSVAWWLLKRSGDRIPKGHRGTAWTLPRLLAGALAISGIILVTGLIVAKRAKPMIAASVGSRLVYAQGALSAMRSRPLLGTGIGTFGIAYQAFKPLENSEGQHTALHAHNTLLEIGTELGLVGLTLFLLFCLKVWQLIGQAARQDAAEPFAVLQRGLAIGLLAFFIHGLLEQTFFESVTAPFWWIALGLLSGASSVSRSGQPVFLVNKASRIGVIPPLLMSCLGLLIGWRFVMADIWLAQGALLDMSEQPEQSQAAFAKAQRWDPFTSRFPLEQGERLLKRARARSREEAKRLLEQAQEQFERATMHSPQLGYAWLRLSMTSWLLGQADRAIQEASVAARLDPNSRAARIHLAQMFKATGRFEELTEVARQFQRLEPSDPQGYFWEALGWQRLGIPQRAVDAYRRFLTKAPNYYPALFNLATLLRDQGASAEAAGYYAAFLRASPETQSVARKEAEAFLQRKER